MSERDRLAGVTELSSWIAAKHDDAAPPGADPEQIGELTGGQVDEEAARSIALRALGRRAVSRVELDRTLERRDVDAEVRASVLDRLSAEGLVDDTQLAQEVAARLRERKQLGERGVAAELRRRGLDPSAIEGVDADVELQRAIDAAADRRRRLAGLDEPTVERRLAGFLQRRGFGGSAVRLAIERTRPRGPRFR